jgi:uncharacterized membrane protein YhaH (DUF805 family)
MDWAHVLFSFKGRINRAKFWLGILVIVVANFASLFISLQILRVEGFLVVFGSGFGG